MMQNINIYIYGLGQLGSSLIQTFVECNIPIQTVSSRSAQSRNRTQKQLVDLGAETHITLKDSLQLLLCDFNSFINTSKKNSINLLFLCVQDDTIYDLVHLINHQKEYELEIIHCSAAKGLTDFRKQKITNVHLFHPFLSIKHAQKLALNSVVGIETQKQEIEIFLESLAKKIGLTSWILKKNQSVQYHLAASLTANLSLALFQKSLSLLTDLQIDKAESSTALISLWRSTLNNIEKKGADNALTGPLARGDRDTICKHINILATNNEVSKKAQNSSFEDIYKLLSLELLKNSGLENNKIFEIQKILNA